MKKTINIFCILAAVAVMNSCKPKAYTAEDLFVDESRVSELTKDGKLYTFEEFRATFMTEQGNYKSDSSLYRTRATNGDGIYLFSIDTLPSQGEGIYIMGRICTDDYGGNYYKSLVLQQIVDGKQQNLRISLDMGSAGGVYNRGQILLIRCNGLAIGRYANQPQLCVPTYTNNTLAQNATEKVGWAPGRIPASMFRKATTLIGIADASKLVYEEMTMAEYQKKYLNEYRDIIAAREMDGRLVRLKDVHYTGEYENNGSMAKLTQYSPADPTVGNPEKDGNSNVFGPTTTNIGYPQSRVIASADEKIKSLVSCSEYAKFANYYIPSKISSDFMTFDYKDVSGNITGILGYYADNAKYTTSDKIDQWNWAVTPCDLTDFDMHYSNGQPWVPVEFSKGNF